MIPFLCAWLERLGYHLYRRLTDALTELDNHIDDHVTPRFTTYRKDHL